jgi:predicted permease
MNTLRVIAARLRGLISARRRDADLNDEVDGHLDLIAQEHVRRGMPAAAARAAARREFGGVEQIKAIYRDQRGLPFVESWLQDMRYAVRTLRTNRGFAATAVLTLAFGIGVNTAIFSVVDAVVIKPLAYREADRLVAIQEIVRRVPLAPIIPVNATHFEEWREKARSFEQIALLRGISVNLTGSGEPERIPAGRVSSSLFPMLGVQAQLGRTFLESEDQAGRDRVVVLTDALWRRRFGADPQIVGRRIRLDDQPFEVVGVLPRDFRFPTLNHLLALSIAATEPQLWKPFGLRDDERSPNGDYNYACLARLRPGVAASQALAELNAIQAAIEARLATSLGLAATVVPLRNQITSRSRTGLWLLLTAAGVVLLIACVNITNLLLARGSARTREFSIRRAIGATGPRLAKQLLAESSVLGGSGAVLGVVIAYAAIAALTRYAPADLPRVGEIHLDGRVLLFTLALAIVTTMGVGLIPAWRTARSESGRGDSTAGRTITATRTTNTLRALLVTLEISLSAICLVSAGLLLHSFVKLMRIDKGFETEHVMLVDLNLSPQRYPDFASVTRFVRAVLDQTSSVPALASVGVVNQPPLAGAGVNNQLLVEGAAVPAAERPIADIRTVNPAYFQTMGIGLRAGRIFDDSDETRPVALVSAMTAARVWPGENPLGKRFRIGAINRPLIEVIGTVGDVRGVRLADEPSPTVYVPYWQRAFNRNRIVFAVRSRAGAGVAGAAIRDVVHRLDRELPVPAPRTMDDIVADSTASRRFQVVIILSFAATALLLASLGTYGVMTYAVQQRSREIGIRLALGARRAAILRTVLIDAGRLVGYGLIAGIPAAVAVGFAMRALLFGVVAHDGITLAAVCGVLAATAMFAALLPAWRASRIDPLMALRHD